MFTDGQAVWVQGKKAVVSHTDAAGKIWVQFENNLDEGAFCFEASEVCNRSIRRSSRAEGRNFVD